MALEPINAQSALLQSDSELALRWHIYAALRSHENQFNDILPAAFIDARKQAYADFVEAFK